MKTKSNPAIILSLAAAAAVIAWLTHRSRSAQTRS